IPVVPPERSPRPELLAALRAAADAKLVLVSAPAGAGKSTLLSSWHASTEETREFAWVSLDDTDNDPVRFWSCVVAAVRTLVPGFEAEGVSVMRASRGSRAEQAIPLVVNELAALEARIVVVLDDFHAITNEEIHRSVAYLLEHLPSAVQLAIASRSEPPLPIARLRARGEVVELNMADLRLNVEQAAALLNGSLGLSLEPDEIARLQSRTEGWAAGLQLVGLSLRGRTDSHAYIDSFAGDDRQIVDYLGLEVLDRQPLEVRSFLLRTSVLDRLCGPLCDAVNESSGSSAMLTQLERANLFLIALDGKREWYRYHHLFGELMRHRLAEDDPEIVPVLHRRAQDWLEDEGLAPDSIRHAVAAGDHAVAARLIAANWLTYVNRGELETVSSWTRALPPEAVESDPRLCLAHAWMHLVLGRLDEVEPAVRAAEAGELPGPMQDGSSSVEASAAMVRTSARLMLGDVAGACATAADASRLESDPSSPWRPIATNAVGMSAYWSGREDEAWQAFSETVVAAERVGNHSACIYALGYLAAICAARGEQAELDAFAQRALTLAREHDLAEHWVTVMVRYASAEGCRQRGDLDVAELEVRHALDLARGANSRLDVCRGLMLLARVRHAQGSPREAEALLAETE
ncbi:MAG TPA: AAA family ATPase, partial [Gaiellaceae bacterium]|nr:AAA family ATPase [Gaiellaceae bacterium]